MLKRHITLFLLLVLFFQCNVVFAAAGFKGAGGLPQTPLNIANGGTNATTAPAAVASLGASPAAGSASIITVGTVTTGVWNATALVAAYLPASTAYINAANSWSVDQVPNGAGTINFGSAALPWLSLYLGTAATNNQHIVSSITTAARTFTFPDANSNPVQPATAAAHQFLTAISSAGLLTYTQPVIADVTNGLSNVLTSGQLFVGSAGNVATGVALSGDATLISTGAITLKNTGPGAVSFTNSSITLDAQGRITAASSGAGGGSVTSFSSGNLAPLFTTSVATATTTPALSYTLSGCTAYQVLGDFAGSTTPGYGTLVNSNLPVGAVVFGGSGGTSSVRSFPTTGVASGEYWNHGNWTQTGAITCTGCRVHIDGTCTVNGLFTVVAELPGGVASPAVPSALGGHGIGLGGGDRGITLVGSDIDQGGGGGGFGGVGGNGGSLNGRLTGIGGTTYNIRHQLVGSSGGAGNTQNTASGAGGAGGGGLLIECSGAFHETATGDIEAVGVVGGAGSASTNNSGGGGSGGGVDIRSLSTSTIDVGGIVNTSGGAGGAAFDVLSAAGGGGGGGFLAMHGTASAQNGTYTKSGGAAGAGGGSASAAGAIGTSLVENVVWFTRTAP